MVRMDIVRISFKGIGTRVRVKNSRNKASLHNVGVQLYVDGELDRLIPFHNITVIEYDRI